MIVLTPGTRHRLVVRVACAGARCAALPDSGEVPGTDVVRAGPAGGARGAGRPFRLNLFSNMDPGLPTEVVWEAARGGQAGALRAVVERTTSPVGTTSSPRPARCLPTCRGYGRAHWTPAWSADYTMNGNVQNGVLAAAIWTGTPELIGSLFALVRPFARRLPQQRQTPVRCPRPPPAVADVHPRPYEPFRPQLPARVLDRERWVLLRFAYDYLVTTGDRGPLDSWLVGLRGRRAGLLRDRARAGRRTPSPRAVILPREHPPRRRVALAVDATMDVAIIADSYGWAWNWLRWSTTTATTRAGPRWQRPCRRTASRPTERSPSGSTLPSPTRSPHRHCSQLYPLWYELDPHFPPQPSCAGPRARPWRARSHGARRTRPRLRDAWRWRSGLLQLGLAAAALGDADGALQCATWLARDHWTPAMVSTHDGGAIFGLDASGSLPALVAAMLLGSTRGEMTILPALPSAWPSGSVTGLVRAAGSSSTVLPGPPLACRPPSGRFLARRWLRPGATTVRAATSGPTPCTSGRHSHGLRSGAGAPPG